MSKGTKQALDDFTKTIILLNCIPAKYHVVKNALQYIGIVPKLDLFFSCLKAREIELIANRKTRNNLYAKCRIKKKESSNVFDQFGGSSTKGKKKDKKPKQKPK